MTIPAPPPDTSPLDDRPLDDPPLDDPPLDGPPLDGPATGRPPSSSATVATDRPARFGRQLVSHLGRRVETSWDDETGHGTLTFPYGRAHLTAAEASLDLYVEVGPDAEPDLQGDAGLERLEDVVGRHLVRFGARDELAVHWRRSDGSAGTQQAS